jgi:DNA-directed RNA polymerase specialized sigma24 family protein
MSSVRVQAALARRQRYAGPGEMAMNVATPLTAAPLALVASHCQVEHSRFHGGQPHDARYAEEIVRRAIVERDEAAWEALHAIYSPQVAAWCRRAGAREDELDDLCAVAWEKFWRAFGCDRLRHATGIGAVLQYLMLCATSVVFDARRKAAGAARFALDLEPEQAELLLPVAEAEEPDWHEFRALVWRCLHSDAERMLVRLQYGRGYRSADVQRLRPDLFRSVEDVYRTHHTLFDRLRRNKALRSWFVTHGFAAPDRKPPD